MVRRRWYLPWGLPMVVCTPKYSPPRPKGYPPYPQSSRWDPRINLHYVLLVRPNRRGFQALRIDNTLVRTCGDRDLDPASIDLTCSGVSLLPVVEKIRDKAILELGFMSYDERAAYCFADYREPEN